MLSMGAALSHLAPLGLLPFFRATDDRGGGRTRDLSAYTRAHEHNENISAGEVPKGKGCC